MKKANGITMRYTLYLVTDRELSLGRSTEEIVTSSIKGGVTCVQLREKLLDTCDFIREARVLKKILQPLSIPLIINDRVDVAMASGADGVHLGQRDMAISDARRLLGKKAIIGISAECLEDAQQAEKQGADYIAISPVFATATKTDTAAPLGLEGIRIIRREVSIPLIAIGGINTDNVADVITAGADGVAVVSAIVSSSSPEQSARWLRRRITEAQAEK